MRRRDPSAGSAAAGPSIVRAKYGKPATPPGSSETKGKGVFQEIDKHLLIVSDVVAALVDGGTCPKARLARLAFISHGRSGEDDSAIGGDGCFFAVDSTVGRQPSVRSD
jgi:hypothetical protein